MFKMIFALLRYDNLKHMYTKKYVSCNKTLNDISESKNLPWNHDRLWPRMSAAFMRASEEKL